MLRIQPAILILQLVAGFARPSGEQNPQLAAVQAHLRRACTAANLHNENCWYSAL